MRGGRVTRGSWLRVQGSWFYVERSDKVDYMLKGASHHPYSDNYLLIEKLPFHMLILKGNKKLKKKSKKKKAEITRNKNKSSIFAAD